MSKSVWAERLPSGRFSARFRHPITENKERAGSHPTEDEALAAARRKLRELVRLYAGEPEITTAVTAPSIAECAHEAIDALNHIQESSRDRYDTAAKWLVQHFGGVGVDRADVHTARAVVAKTVKDGNGRSSAENRVIALKHIIAWAADQDYTDQQPWAWKVKLPPEIKRQRDVIHDDTLYLITCGMPDWLWPAVLISSDTGLRISEAAAVRVEDVDLKRRRLRKTGSYDHRARWRPYSKGGKSGLWIPMSQRLTDALARHFENYVIDGQVFVFVNPRTNKPATVRHVRYRYDAARVLAGASEADWHDLRRKAATVLANLGCPLAVIQLILYHSKPETTMRYINPRELHQTGEKLQVAC